MLRSIALACVLGVATWGCVFRGVKKNIAVMEGLGSVRGAVIRDGVSRGNIRVVVYTPGASVATDVFSLTAPGQYLASVSPAVGAALSCMEYNR